MSTSPTRTHITTRSPVRGWKQLTFASGIAGALATSPAVDVGPNPPVPNGVELECKTTSS